MKLLSKQLLNKTTRANKIANIAEEMDVMKTLKHENIVMLYEIVDDPKRDEIYLFMDLLSNGTL